MLLYSALVVYSAGGVELTCDSDLWSSLVSKNLVLAYEMSG